MHFEMPPKFPEVTNQIRHMTTDTMIDIQTPAFAFQIASAIRQVKKHHNLNHDYRQDSPDQHIALAS